MDNAFGKPAPSFSTLQPSISPEANKVDAIKRISKHESISRVSEGIGSLLTRARNLCVSVA
ncbi:hypothetical protein APH_0826 [Anaplasma phagocytophilum str. HZ]|uniref:Uncharacterized protein n=1 Tax=Anaplasma phagocytophilum (strain HZ) TaxID=212042 RepID=Q2GJP8_ANAPZ|nr:hypothetical protein APH_0826 [Anaplasma phagocytophilum str. HZ]